jgi:hypothetical protein
MLSPPGKTIASKSQALSVSSALILPRAILADSCKTFLFKNANLNLLALISNIESKPCIRLKLASQMIDHVHLVNVWGEE